MNNVARWDFWQSRKQVWAAPIVGVREHDVLVGLPDGGTEPFVPTAPEVFEYAEVGTIAIIYQPDKHYPEGYRTVYTKEPFNEGYELVKQGRLDV